MKTINLKIASGLMLILFIVYSCASVPLTGRKQLNLLPESEMVSMALTSYDEFLKENPLSTNVQETKMVKEVGAKIAEAVKTYLTNNNMADRIKDYNWEFNYVQNDEPNAWCMPGGKVVVYSGIMTYAKSDAMLAVVLGHEIAHAVARHGNERMSQGLLIQMGGTALDVALKEKPAETRALFQQAYGVGSQIGIALPYSRQHESEADKMGLIFMAMAGYNPEVAIQFWENMASAGGVKPPELLSTHPSDQTRINNLKAFMPEALKYYKR